MMKYANHFDATLMCPPYFDMEIYPSNGKQSIEMYQIYKMWLTNYWKILRLKYFWSKLSLFDGLNI